MDNAWQHVILAALALLVMCLAAIVQSTVGLTSAQRIRQFAPAPKDARDGRDDLPRHRTVQSLVDPRRILAASMILLQVLMAILATGALIRAFEAATDSPLQWLAMLIVASVFIVFGLALPRAIASKEMDRFLGAVLRLGHLATILLVPLNWIVEQVALGFSRVLPGHDVEPDNVALEEELRPRRIERDDEVIGADEQEMIDGILSLEEMTVRDIMVPR
ncbi:MAG: CNNM domain-containing protein, partial [Chloroflexota bacterium]|nr:CNNM domain-containing protein [Chloroflexota bacterium]